MKRRDFLRASALLAASALVAPPCAVAQQRSARFCDLHAHMGFRRGSGFREAMAKGGMLIVGIGSDLNGIVRTIMPGYEQFAALEDALASCKLRDENILAVLGGNYVRVLRQSLSTS